MMEKGVAMYRVLGTVRHLPVFLRVFGTVRDLPVLLF